MKPKTKKAEESLGTFTTGYPVDIKGEEKLMDQDKRLQKLELEMQKIMEFLPKVELWMNVLAAQFQTNRNFVLSLEKKPETPKEEKVVEPTVPNA